MENKGVTAAIDNLGSKYWSSDSADSTQFTPLLSSSEGVLVSGPIKKAKRNELLTCFQPPQEINQVTTGNDLPGTFALKDDRLEAPRINDFFESAIFAERSRRSTEDSMASSSLTGNSLMIAIGEYNEFEGSNKHNHFSGLSMPSDPNRYTQRLNNELDTSNRSMVDFNLMLNESLNYTASNEPILSVIGPFQDTTNKISRTMPVFQDILDSSLLSSNLPLYSYPVPDTTSDEKIDTTGILYHSSKDDLNRCQASARTYKYPRLQKYESFFQHPYNSSLSYTEQIAENFGNSEFKTDRRYWEDEKTETLNIEVDGTTISRRLDNDMINGTKLLNFTGMTRGKRDGILKNEMVRKVIKTGSMFLKGVWIPFESAKSLAEKHGIYEKIKPLFEPDIRKLLIPHFWPLHFGKPSTIYDPLFPETLQYDMTNFQDLDPNYSAGTYTTSAPQYQSPSINYCFVDSDAGGLNLSSTNTDNIFLENKLFSQIESLEKADNQGLSELEGLFTNNYNQGITNFFEQNYGDTKEPVFPENGKEFTYKDEYKEFSDFFNNVEGPFYKSLGDDRLNNKKFKRFG
ncbi:hypothetical protein BB560_005347 [Smittium megazygosporum]|uniref:HTH APSES-type domain-containing protein n=1 Tax=Smittium megazygosporum TaxID=133381 RepID=A0A2T9Z6X1_9FUNG|nr:hypothetical protein BB560_005347 [Smittium megazygosporum]